MANFNLNISTLFSSLQTNNAFSAFNFSDYRAIKNGSYGKLMKSYYADQKSENVKPDKNTSSVNKKKTLTDTTGMTKMKKEADGLKGATEALGKAELWEQTAGKYDVDKIVGAVKDFAKEYNEVLDQASKVTGNSKLVSSVGYMKSLTSTMTKALSNIGVSVDVTGKMSVNAETLKSAKMSDVKSLFSGVASYGKQIEKDAVGIASAVVMGSSIYNSSGIASSALSGMFDSNI